MLIQLALLALQLSSPLNVVFLLAVAEPHKNDRLFALEEAGRPMFMQPSYLGCGLLYKFVCLDGPERLLGLSHQQHGVFASEALAVEPYSILKVTRQGTHLYNLQEVYLGGLPDVELILFPEVLEGQPVLVPESFAQMGLKPVAQTQVSLESLADDAVPAEVGEEFELERLGPQVLSLPLVEHFGLSVVLDFFSNPLEIAA
jgi:hypothetical protein